MGLGGTGLGWKGVWAWGWGVGKGAWGRVAIWRSEGEEWEGWG